MSAISADHASRRLDAARLPRTLVDALLQARARCGGGRVILEDHERRTLTYDALFTAAHALARQLNAVSEPGERVGVMLPTSIPAVVTFFALHLGRRTPAMLSYSASAETLRACCELAGVRTVITSHRFVREARLGEIVSALAHDRRIIEIERLVARITWLDRLSALAQTYAPHFITPQAERVPAVVLFTSGTTGAPKGVVLSHANLLANVEQCRRQTPFDPSWVFFNTLPIFHAFGLTGGVLLPILSGLKTVLYPSPLHRDRIPALIEATRANVLISTDTFASYYARAAAPRALESLRYVVLGAERVRSETRAAFAEASNAVVLEGYGATECAPVVAVNQPEANRPGTVGKPLPGIDIRIEPVAGVAEGGLLYVRGPNVMQGYLREHGGVKPPPGGWFDTGDLASLDEDGFLTIVGRLKRFARIGAEMVSLDLVEANAQRVWPSAQHAAIATPAETRSEQIVLVTDQHDASKQSLVAWARAHGVRPLELPQRIFIVDDMPALPTGKTDYAAVRKLVAARLKTPAN